MPKSQQTLDKIKEERRQKILTCALMLFCKKGYYATTVNDIAKKAKCSHGLFYHYFKNKKELFDAVCEMRGTDMIVFIDDVLATEENYVDKLRRIVEYTFASIKKDEIFAYKYYFFVSTVFAKAEKNILPPKTEKQPPHIKMYTLFEEGIMRGDFQPKYNAKECNILYNSIIQGATLNFILCPKEFKKQFKFPTIDFILDIFKGERQ